ASLGRSGRAVSIGCRQRARARGERDCGAERGEQGERGERGERGRGARGPVAPPGPRPPGVIEPIRLSFEVACPPEQAFDVWTLDIDRWWPADHTVTGTNDL